ncbi:YecA/YgfB family protein [Andreprevotia chitinilytica]|uniref:YecA/YgfB family protein n=1 Tax=Andreprevotia chitinilytica TaxID=396808 RepID=UPI000557712E|nr:YecA family protein [Andreprevotia chitinilytica]
MAKDQELIAPLTETELDELASFLESDASPEQAMDLSMLQGFLTAQLVGPEEPLPDAWFGLVWGENGERPKWESPAQQEHIGDLILRLYNQLSDELRSEPPTFTPMVYQDEERQLDIAQQWCYGFMLGTSVNAEGWQEMLDDDDGIELIAPILDCADDEARASMEEAGDDIAQFEHDLAAALPEIVPAIHAYWLDRAPAPKRAPGRRR